MKTTVALMSMLLVIANAKHHHHHHDEHHHDDEHHKDGADFGMDWRKSKKLGNTVSAVRNYMGMPGKQCSKIGWSFAATAMVADRLAILQPEQPKVQLSNQVILNCVDEIDGCKDRGTIDMALRFIMDNDGIPDRTCMGFRGQQETCSKETMCINCLPGKCETRPVYLKYKISSYTRLDVQDVQRLKKEIRKHGPIACELKDGRYGTLVGYGSDQTFISKFDLGVYYGQDGFMNVTSSELAECWAATVVKPFRFHDKQLEKAREEELARQKSGDLVLGATLEGELPRRFEGHAPVQKPRLRSELVLSTPPRHLTAAEMPKNFSWMAKDGKSLLTPVQSHHNGPGYCGACWSMASSSAFSDRLKIMRGGASAPDVFVSPQATVDCVRGAHSSGCGGGSADDVFTHMKEYGTVDETCNVWVSGEQTCVQNGAACKQCDEEGKCSAVDESKYQLYRAKEWGNVRGELDMMNEILARGPIDCGIATPPALDEFFYGDSIICDKDTPPEKWEITHDVSIVGFGETAEGQKYWLVRNSWSTAFGDNGFFKVCRGEDQPDGNMLLESACSWVVPEI